MKRIIAISFFSIVIFGGCHQDSPPYSASLKLEEMKNSDMIIFRFCTEPNEGAFSFLLPEKWIINGGITRVKTFLNDDKKNISIPKLYLKLTSPDNLAGLGWLPDNDYVDNFQHRNEITGKQVYSGDEINQSLTSMKILSPYDFIRNVAIPFAHPHAHDIRFVHSQEFQLTDEILQKKYALLYSCKTKNYISVVVTYEYRDHGIDYTEKMFCTIESERDSETKRWGNIGTWYIRAETSIFSSLVPVFDVICQSIKMNPGRVWQEFPYQKASIPVGKFDPRQDIHENIEEFVNLCKQNITEMANGMNQGGRECKKGVNPFTGNTEYVSDYWRYCWINLMGDIIYSNRETLGQKTSDKSVMKGFRRIETIK